MEIPKSENICGTKHYPYCVKGCTSITYGWDKNSFAETESILAFYDTKDIRCYPLTHIIKATDIANQLGYIDLKDLGTRAKTIMYNYLKTPHKLFKGHQSVRVMQINKNTPIISINANGALMSFQVRPIGFESIIFMVVFEHNIYSDKFKLVAQYFHENNL